MGDLTVFLLASQLHATLRVLDEVLTSTGYELDAGQIEVIEQAELDCAHHLPPSEEE